MIRDRTEHYLIILLEFAIALAGVIDSINKESFQNFKLRVGLAHGPVVAGVVGAQKPQYDIWGNTVNVASRMDSCGLLGRIQATEETAKVLIDAGWDCYCRGPTKIKGKGTLRTYIVQPPAYESDLSENKVSKICGMKNEDCGALLRSPFSLTAPARPAPTNDEEQSLGDKVSAPQYKERSDTKDSINSAQKGNEVPEETRIQISDYASNNAQMEIESSDAQNPTLIPLPKARFSPPRNVSNSNDHNFNYVKATDEEFYKPRGDNIKINNVPKQADILPTVISCNSSQTTKVNTGTTNGETHCRTPKPKTASCILQEKPYYVLHLHKKSKSEENISELDRRVNKGGGLGGTAKADTQVVFVDNKSQSKLSIKTNPDTRLSSQSISSSSQREDSPVREICRKVSKVSIDSNYSDRHKHYNSSISKRKSLDGKCQIIFPKNASRKRTQIFV